MNKFIVLISCLGRSESESC